MTLDFVLASDFLAALVVEAFAAVLVGVFAVVVVEASSVVVAASDAEVVPGVSSSLSGTLVLKEKRSPPCMNRLRGSFFHT
jgi:hypothetical protein